MGDDFRLPWLWPGTTLIAHQIGDIVRDDVTGEEQEITADSVIVHGRFGEMHMSHEMFDRLVAEVDRQAVAQGSQP